MATSAALRTSVLRTLAYADVFDFAMTPGELHRYLVAERASPSAVTTALVDLGREVVMSDGLVALAGRESLLPLRTERRRVTARTWPAALRYARAVGGLPFVRMVAVTGALAAGNAIEGADIDLLVVTSGGRLWTARAGAIALVRFAARRGDELCPNYLLAEHALALDTRDLYSAHELAQMVPVIGLEVYHRLRGANPWAIEQLPNATGLPLVGTLRTPALRRPRAAGEAVLRGPIGALIEGWEQRRKVARLRSQAVALGGVETGFGPDRCKGHFEGHAARIREGYEARARAAGVEPVW